MPSTPFPVYQLKLSDEGGIEFVALVDEPAIQENFLAFNAQKPLALRFKATDVEQRIISGPLMVADMLIFRDDAVHGEHYVYFDAETIKCAVLKFFASGRTNAVNLMHDSAVQPQGIYMFESFLIDSERGVHTPAGFDPLPDGSWFGSYKVDNEALWREFIKTGTFKGFSIEGFFSYAPAAANDAVREAEMVRQMTEMLKDAGFDIVND
jgi:hypothetical protein